jgi:hypothetical protein
MAISIIDFVNMSYTFEFHVEEYIQCSKTFEWFVGDGPLYWYRIEWKNPKCPPRSCDPEATTCSVTPTTCTECNQAQDTCTCGTGEVWHVLATSMQHLCVRLNTECCMRPPKGKVFKKVQKYDRPALCCDVDRFIEEQKEMTDQYIDVNFCECGCVSWVDPCDCGDIYVPCDEDVPAAPCLSVSSQESTLSTIMLFGLPQMAAASHPGFAAESIKVMEPKLGVVPTKCECDLPSTLVLKHNLQQTAVLKEFLGRYKQNLGDVFELGYSKHNDCWQKIVHLAGGEEKWRVLTEWSCVADVIPGKFGWKLNILVTKEKGGKSQKTKIVLQFAPEFDKRKSFGVNFSLNTKSQTALSNRQPVLLRSRLIQDEIGLFKGSWGNELKIAVEGKKG